MLERGNWFTFQNCIAIIFIHENRMIGKCWTKLSSHPTSFAVSWVHAREIEQCNGAFSPKRRR
jgi:hypothetical protein